MQEDQLTAHKAPRTESGCHRCLRGRMISHSPLIGAKVFEALSTSYFPKGGFKIHFILGATGALSLLNIKCYSGLQEPIIASRSQVLKSCQMIPPGFRVLTLRLNLHYTVFTPFRHNSKLQLEAGIIIKLEKVFLLLSIMDTS